ncbi:MAG: hypothetical protein ACYDCK_06275 [Thermoplasmatota archaeon]
MWPSKFLAALAGLLAFLILLALVPARAAAGDCQSYSSGLAVVCGHTPQGDNGASVQTLLFFVYAGASSGPQGGASAGAGSLAGVALDERSARPTVIVAAYGTTVFTYETVTLTQDGGDGYRADLNQHHYGEPGDRPSSDLQFGERDFQPSASGDIASGALRFADSNRGASASVLGVALPIPGALP